jgi:ACS family tartrate transporter-like MFS transporter
MTSPDIRRATIAKVTRRTLPFLMLCFFIAFVDRVNVSVASLQMNDDLGLSDAAFGLGAGIFFIGYVLFEVPSNLVLDRVGARKWIARIMITWGLVTIAMMFVTGPKSFYAMRFLLGVAEAGFYPGVIYYLSQWFPAQERGRGFSLFQTAAPIALAIGSPLAGLLLGLDGVAGLEGWQWIFLVTGIPAVVVGFITFFYLTDKPADASWLTAEERTFLTATMREEREQHGGGHGLRAALRNKFVWLLSAIYFLIVMSLYGVTFWLPKTVKNIADTGDLVTSLLAAIPWVAAALAIIFVARHSDRTRECRFHVAIPCFAGAAGLALTALTLGQPIIALAALALAAAGIQSGIPPFWGLPTAFLSGTAAAGAIALINSLGNIGGFTGPYLAGLINDATGSDQGALWMLCATLASAGALVLVTRRLVAKESAALAEPRTKRFEHDLATTLRTTA